MPERAPYDLIAEDCSPAKAASGFGEKQYIDRFFRSVGPNGHILDLACGPGRPIARYLLDGGYRGTGIDASSEMVNLAWQYCPEATLITGYMTLIELSDPYHGIIAWNSVFHIPKAQHEQLSETINQWLLPGAPIFLSVGGSGDEFTAAMFGVDCFSAVTPRKPVWRYCVRPVLTSFCQKSMILPRGDTWPIFVSKPPKVIFRRDGPIWR